METTTDAIAKTSDVNVTQEIPIPSKGFVINTKYLMWGAIGLTAAAIIGIIVYKYFTSNVELKQNSPMVMQQDPRLAAAMMMQQQQAQRRRQMPRPSIPQTRSDSEDSDYDDEHEPDSDEDDSQFVGNLDDLPEGRTITVDNPSIQKNENENGNDNGNGNDNDNDNDNGNDNENENDNDTNEIEVETPTRYKARNLELQDYPQSKKI